MQRMHITLLGLLPDEEKGKHNIWFKAKLLHVDEFTQSVGKSLMDGSDGITKNVDLNEDNDEINPTESVSNVGTRTSSGSSRSSRSKASLRMACIKAEAKRAALLARAAALKRKHTGENDS